MNLRIPEDLGSARSCAAAWPAIEEAFEWSIRQRTEDNDHRYAVDLIRDKVRRGLSINITEAGPVMRAMGIGDAAIASLFNITAVRVREILGDGFDQ